MECIILHKIEITFHRNWSDPETISIDTQSRKNLIIARIWVRSFCGKFDIAYIKNNKFTFDLQQEERFNGFCLLRFNTIIIMVIPDWMFQCLWKRSHTILMYFHNNSNNTTEKSGLKAYQSKHTLSLQFWFIYGEQNKKKSQADWKLKINELKKIKVNAINSAYTYIARLSRTPTGLHIWLNASAMYKLNKFYGSLFSLTLLIVCSLQNQCLICVYI